MSRKRKYSDEFRLMLVDEYLSGKNGGFKSIAKKYGINHSVVERWVHLYETHGSEGLCSSLGRYKGSVSYPRPTKKHILLPSKKCNGWIML
jgi:transposase-like protein